MSTKTTYYCDRCGLEMSQPQRVTTRKPSEYSLWRKGDYFDICGSCMESFRAWVAAKQ